MSKKALVILLAMAAVLGIAATQVTRTQQSEMTEEAQQATVPGLKDKLNAITHLRFTRGDNVTDLVATEDGVWQVEQLKDYPADREKIRQFLYRLSSSTHLEKKTADPALLSRIRLSDKTALRAVGMAGKSGEESPAFDILIGKYDDVFRGTFLRAQGDEQSWLVSENLKAEPEALYWVDPVIVNIDRARVWKIFLKSEGKPAVEIDRINPGGDFTLKNILVGKELTAHYDIYTISTALENMKLANVAKAEKTPDAVKTIARFEMLDGLVITVEIAPGLVKGTHWAKVSARFDPVLVVDSEEAKKLAKSPEDVQKEVEEITAQTGQWIYILSEFPYKLLTKTMDDLTKKVTSSTKGSQKK